ncbi:type II toxin-antitoxin system VapC family toxin [Terriglobus sp. RCC_193]|uniref:type II toxin-antitoxin system VapC family toxin n=1 Tax=Terriglobus sp. RCC_193 TaxID=3239218 RepID=UPI0035254205
MNLLLDSHILLWYADADLRLTETAISSIQDARELYFSAAGIWELSLKMHGGKLPQRDVQALALHLGCTLLSIAPEHAAAVVELPRLHNDPFDHLLLAQARMEGLTLVTHDRILSEYGVPVLLV